MAPAMAIVMAVLIAVVAAAPATPVLYAQTTSRLPLIAILEPASTSAPPGGIAQFRQALGELGWVEGRTVRFETRYGEWQPERIAAMARELVALKPDILYTHSEQAVRAAMQATGTIPIVAGAASDLLAMGAVKSLAQLGGNVTGVTHAQPELDRKRLEVLKESVPAAVRIGFLAVRAPVPGSTFHGLEESAPRLGVKIQNVVARAPGQIEGAFAAMAKDGVQAVLVQDTPVFSRNAEQVAALALRHRMPTMSQIPRFAERGGLLQYGADVYELFRRSATHVDRILKGAKPADLPVEQPTKVELIVNLKTARALRITIPGTILVRADRVIE